MRILVTGASGFVGRWLLPYLRERGHEIIATVGPDFTGEPPEVLAWRRHDLTADPDLPAFLRQHQPERVLHLAGFSSVRRSWEAPAGAMQANLMGSLGLWQALLDAGFQGVFISIGSSEEYGPKAGKLTEEDPPQPANPYALAKYAQGQLLQQLATKAGLSLLHLRPFNHIGPGQPRGFVAADLASQVMDRAAGRITGPLRVGNLAAVRDFLDVRDVVAAYTKVLEHPAPPPGVYNLASGQGQSIRDLLNGLLAIAGVDLEIEVDPALFRPLEVPSQIGDARKFRETFNWHPEIPWRKTVRDLLEYWRQP